MLDLAILGALRSEALHGYELSKRLTDLFGPGSSISFGSIYPALSRLERAEHVRAAPERPTPSPIPMTGSLAGELAAAAATLPTRGEPKTKRKVYWITDTGTKHLRELLIQPTGARSTSGFSLRLALLQHLEEVDRVAVLRHRRTALTEQRLLLERSSPTTFYGRARRSRDLETTNRELAWLEDLIVAEPAAL